MSIPISMCDVAEACCVEQKYIELLTDIKNNIKYYGHYSIIPCSCGKHSISDDEINQLNTKLLKDLGAKT